MASTSSPEGKPKEKAVARGTYRLDMASIVGAALAAGGIIGGMVLEGGRIREILQPTAAMIVFGGTLGAVLVTTPLRVLRNAARKFTDIFREPRECPGDSIERLVEYATKARKNGIVSLENELTVIDDPFLKKALTLAVDGSDVKEIRSMMDLEIHLEGQHYDDAARVFSSAGGYAPTVGIIGAVLGLMQVMKNLTNIDEVGRGIATAFVATVYGVGVANIFFLPAGNKIRARFQAARQVKELTLRGVVSIVEGVNPKLLRVNLEAFVNHWEAKKPEQKKEAKATKPVKATVPAAETSSASVAMPPATP